MAIPPAILTPSKGAKLLSNPIVTGAEYLNLPRSPETWLVDSLLPVGGSMLLFGDPKVGKSFAALQLACCLTSGVEWLGFDVPTHTSVVYLQLDTPRTLWADRVDKLRSSGHPVEAVHMADRDTLNTHPFDILNPEHFKKLSDSLASIKPGVVIFDTLRESHSGDENDSTEMQEVISHLDHCVKPSALILISHARKSNPQYGYDLLNDNRGSSYVVGRMDAIVRFTPKSVRVTSRTMEEHSINLDRLDDGTWEVPHDSGRERAAAEIFRENPTIPVREMARLLHERTHKSESACRAYMRRYLAKLSGPKPHFERPTASNRP